MGKRKVEGTEAELERLKKELGTDKKEPKKKPMKVKKGTKKTKALSRKAEKVVPKKNLAKKKVAKLAKTKKVKKPAKKKTVKKAVKKAKPRARARVGARAPARDEKTQIKKEVMLRVKRQFTVKGEVVKTEDADEMIEVRIFATQPAVAKLMYGLTLNFGNFEGCRLDVGLDMPCYVEEKEAAMNYIADFVGKRIQSERDEIIEHKQKLKAAV